MAKSKTKRYVTLEESKYRKRKRDSDSIEALKPLIEKAHKLLRHKKVADKNNQSKPHEHKEKAIKRG